MRCLSLPPSARFGALILTVVPLLLTGCLPEPCIDTTLTALQTEIFTPSCATSSCHGGAAPSRGLDMNAGATLASSLDVEAVEPGWVRVVPGDTDASLLYNVLLDSVGNTRRMPPGFSLDECKAAAVRVWIEEGAQDD